MNRPVVVVQLSDSHVGATWVDMDPVASLTAVIEQVRRLEPSPDAIVLSGDLAEHGSDSEYEQLAALLDAIEAPRYVLPGNHDDRDALRRHFGAPGAAGTPVQYAVDLGRLRILMLDSTRAGADTGQFDAERLGWIESALAEDPGTPTLLAMHHPPLMTVAPAADAIGFPDADRAALADLVGRQSPGAGGRRRSCPRRGGGRARASCVRRQALNDYGLFFTFLHAYAVSSRA